MAVPDITQDQDPIAAVCTRCGLCCNGVLFANVKLQRLDKPEHLQSLGICLEKKGRAHQFPQPCSCLSGALCTIYNERPQRCRTFECRVLINLKQGKIPLPQALNKINQLREQAELVKKLLRKLGQKDEHLPLSRRNALVMAEPLDLSGDEEILELRAELMMAVQKMVYQMDQDFLA